MKKTLKGPATAFFVLSLIFVIAWLVVFALHGLLGYNFDFNLFTEGWLKPRIDALLPFFKGESYGFTPDNPNFYWTYIGFGVLGLMLIFMIVHGRHRSIHVITYLRMRNLFGIREYIFMIGCYL